MKYWHYTVGNNFNSILTDGEIKPAILHIGSGERPLVWFSTNPKFEETARKAIRNKISGKITRSLSLDELFKNGITPVRIEIDPRVISLYSWDEIKKLNYASNREAKLLEKSAYRWEAKPKEWWASLRPVPVHCFKSVDIWDGNAWARLNK